MLWLYLGAWQVQARIPVAFSAAVAEQMVLHTLLVPGLPQLLVLHARSELQNKSQNAEAMAEAGSSKILSKLALKLVFLYSGVASGCRQL